ncbi:MAG: extracellular solute-binding protein [Clostridia bacterium]|nr:extracellular solute-binding protein [Clostridia bacterium]
MKKLLAVLLALMLVAGMCSALAEGEPVKLTLWTFQALHTDLYKAMQEKWNADPSKPTLEIDYQVMPYEEMHDKLTIALQSGEGAPDLVDIEINKFANYLKGDIGLAPMNEYVEPIEDHLVMSRLNNYAKDGKFYGIDHHIGATVLFYNTALLEEAGIDYTTIKTWDDFHEAGKVLLEKTGKPMVVWESADCWSVYPIVNQHGGDWLTPDGKVRMDEPVVIDTLKFMKSMLDDGTAMACPGGNTHSEEFWGWMNGGNCASVSMPFWYLDRFTNYMPDLKGKMKVAAMPLWPDGGHKSAQMGGTGTAVVASSPNVEVAKEFLAFACLSFDGCVTTWKICGFDPILKDVYGSEEMKEPNVFFDYYDQDIFAVLAGVLDDIPDTCISEYFPTASDIVKTQMAYRLVELMEDPEQIAKDCAEELRSQID